MDGKRNLPKSNILENKLRTSKQRMKVSQSYCPQNQKPFLILQYQTQTLDFYKTNQMCFLKTFNTLQAQQMVPNPHSKVQKISLISQYHSQTYFCSFSETEEKPQMTLDSGLILFNCLNLMNLSSQFLLNIDQKLNQTSKILDLAQQFLESPIQIQEQSISNKRSATFSMNLPENVENFYGTSDSLTKVLFGQKQYLYKLVLNGDFANTLYKERNFGCSIKLIDIASGKQKNNGNIINICFGVCDSQGEWIHQTKDGQAFVKGKIETELYHGSADFVKLAPRDVSRQYPNKTVNIVVYPKPTILRYSAESSMEEHIEYNLVEPLIIRDVCIKAKKRE